jgi:uncharacterized protein Yka (UPF0111/DUF47 family)
MGMRRRWFLHDAPDILGLLVEQGRLTIDGIEAFVRWADGSGPDADVVRGLEHEADDARRQVVTALRRAFTTPIEPEDIFEVSERLDEVLNRAKNVVREAEVLNIEPDPAMVDMATRLLAGTRHIATAFPNLASDPTAATAEADAAIKEQRAIEHVYRQAMSALLQSDDLRRVTAYRELYRRVSRAGDAMEAVADRIWYAVVKMG